jgi:hypothetical protein
MARLQAVFAARALVFGIRYLSAYSLARLLARRLPAEMQRKSFIIKRCDLPNTPMVATCRPAKSEMQPQMPQVVGNIGPFFDA